MLDDQEQIQVKCSKNHLLVVGSSARLRRMEQPVFIMDGVRLKETKLRQENLLGIVIQSNLKWSAYIDALSVKLKLRLAGLMKLKFVMFKSLKRNIVQGIFNSVLCYCLPLFGGCSKADLDKLQALQNKAVRIVLNLPPRYNREQMFLEIERLSVRQLIAYHTLVTIYRIRLTKQPEYLSMLLSRDNHNGHIVISNAQNDLLRSSFVFLGGILWNRLPRILRNEEKLLKFKKELRIWILDNIPKFDG